MTKLLETARKAQFLLVLFILCAFTSCVSHLQEAKFHFAEGRDFARSYDRDRAASFYKRARLEAVSEVKKHPSAQAYLVKGMAEMELELWAEAEASFQNAFVFGFEKGEEWAGDLALYGMAVTLNELGMGNVSDRIFAHLMDRSKFKPVVLLSAQRHVEISLNKVLSEEGREKTRALSSVLTKVKRLSQKDLSCAYYHYLIAQICGHLDDYQPGFEEAIMAKELGLPAVEISRDNDLQIIFYYKKLEAGLPGKDRDALRSSYKRWIKKWGWNGPETPDWKK